MEGYKMSSHDGNTGESNQTTCLRQHAWKGTVFYVGSVNYNKDGGGSFSFKSFQCCWKDFCFYFLEKI